MLSPVIHSNGDRDDIIIHLSYACRITNIIILDTSIYLCPCEVVELHFLGEGSRGTSTVVRLPHAGLKCSS